MIKEGSIIQVNEKVKEWTGCVMIVDEVKPYGGVLAYFKIPRQGNVYLILKEDEFDDLDAMAAFVTGPSELDYNEDKYE